MVEIIENRSNIKRNGAQRCDESDLGKRSVPKRLGGAPRIEFFKNFSTTGLIPASILGQPGPKSVPKGPRSPQGPPRIYKNTFWAPGPLGPFWSPRGPRGPYIITPNQPAVLACTGNSLRIYLQDFGSNLGVPAFFRALRWCKPLQRDAEALDESAWTHGEGNMETASSHHPIVRPQTGE